MVCRNNHKLLQVDVTQNSTYEKSDLKKLFSYCLLNNLKKSIIRYYKKNNRINYEWINPELYDIQIVMDSERNKKSEFIQFASQLSLKLNFTYEYVVKAFIGDNFISVLGNS